MDAHAMFAPLDDAEPATPAPKAGEKTPIIPVPADAPPMTFRHPKHGAPSRSWPYHDAGGALVSYVCRWDFEADGALAKDVLPVTYCDLGGGRRGWRSKGVPEPRPLMNLPSVLARGESTILIVEGEKAADAAAELFPDMAVTTPMRGAKSPHLTDFGPVSGRRVVIATDFDEPGRKDAKGKPLHPGRDFGDKVCELARAAGAIEVLHLRPDRLGSWIWRDGERVPREGEMPDGWDLADALAEGWTADRVAAMHSDPAFITHYADAAERRADALLLGDGEGLDDDEEYDGWPFRLVPSGVQKRIVRIDKETGIRSVEWRWFCSQLEVVAETRSHEGEDWGRLLKIVDRDGRSKRWAMPMAMLAGDGVAYRDRLLSLGVELAPGRFARDALHEYVATARPDRKARCVSRVGWHDRIYVGFDENFGERADG